MKDRDQGGQIYYRHRCSEYSRAVIRDVSRIDSAKAFYASYPSLYRYFVGIPYATPFTAKDIVQDIIPTWGTPPDFYLYAKWFHQCVLEHYYDNKLFRILTYPQDKINHYVKISTKPLSGSVYDLIYPLDPCTGPGETLDHMVSAFASDGYILTPFPIQDQAGNLNEWRGYYAPPHHSVLWVDSDD
jgi:hypothetical protein